MTRRGLTLVEVLLALAITSFALLTMIGVFLGGIRLMSQARDVTTATTLARQVLEATEQLGYDALPAEATFDGDAPNGSGFPPAPYPRITANGQTFTLRVSVAPVGTVLKAVTAEVRWGTSGKVHLQTYYRPD